MKRNVLATFMFALLFLTTACKEEEEVPPTPEPTKSELLSAKSWKLTAATATVQGVTGSIMSEVAPCEADNIYKFKGDNTYEEDHATLKCDATEPQIISKGVWTFSEGGKKLTFPPYLFGEYYTFDVNEVTATTVKIGFTADGAKIELTMTAQ
ncbi:MAG: hypothetical protein EAZ95_12225 [Bacteroidetes bacterium]|nr:MAG: hypothetical protein EAZ95_12225 [Bacteroidota bacterium]